MNSVKSVDIWCASEQTFEQNEHKYDADVRNEEVHRVKEEEHSIQSLDRNWLHKQLFTVFEYLINLIRSRLKIKLTTRPLNTSDEVDVFQVKVSLLRHYSKVPRHHFCEGMNDAGEWIFRINSTHHRKIWIWKDITFFYSEGTFAKSSFGEVVYLKYCQKR